MGGLFTSYGAGRTFHTATDMEPWFNQKLRILGAGNITVMVAVLSECHMVIRLRNLLIDKAGDLWISDLACAGFYSPPLFERASLLHKQTNNPNLSFVQDILGKLRRFSYDETRVTLLLVVYQVNDVPFQGSHLIARP
jgi:hypothetical protein